MASSAQCTSSITATVKRRASRARPGSAVNNRSRGAPPSAQLGELAAELRADVEQRAERPRGEQAVAAAPQPAGPRQALLERFEQHGLAHAGLTGHQDQPAVPLPGFGRVLGQRRQKRRPLQQFHGRTAPFTPSLPGFCASPAERSNPARPRRAPAAAWGCPARPCRLLPGPGRGVIAAGPAWRVVRIACCKESFRKIALHAWPRRDARSVKRMTDPRALRALAHPLRLSLLGLLRTRGAADRHPGRRAARRKLRELLLPPAAAGQVRPGRGGGRRPRPGAPVAGHGHAHRRACGRRQPGAGRRVRPVPVDRRRALLRGDDEPGWRPGRASLQSGSRRRCSGTCTCT